MVTRDTEGVTGCPVTPREWSGRPDSNRRRPAWEAGILPLNYGRIAYLVYHRRYLAFFSDMS